MSADGEQGNGISVESLNSIITIGTSVGYLVAVPMTTAIGRRPVLLASCIITAISTTSAGLSQDFGGLAVSIFFQGLAIGVAFGAVSQNQSLASTRLCLRLNFHVLQGILVILDATFVYERPFAIALYWAIVSGTVDLLLIPVPFITDVTVSWRPIYQAYITPSLVSLVVTFLFIPETFFLRPAVALDGRILAQSGSETVRVYDNWESLDAADSERLRPQPDDTTISARWQHLRLTRAPGTEWKAAWATFVQMLLCFANPLVIWVSLLSGVLLCSVIFVNLTQTIYLSGTLQGQERTLMGTFCGVSSAVSSFLGFWGSGPLIARCTRYCAVRCGGNRHAEVYLIGFILPVITGAASITLHAAAIMRQWPPFVHYINFGVANFSFVSGFVATVVWITEAFPPWAAASLAVELAAAILIASLLGINLALWAEDGDILGPCITILILMLSMGMLAMPMAFWGKNVRQYIHGKWSTSGKGALRPQ